MGKKSKFLYVLLTGGIISPAIGQENLSIRGTSIPVPLEIRILLRDALDESIEVSGFELRDPFGKAIPGDAIKCKSRKGKSAFGALLLSPDSLLNRPKQIWFCEAGGNSQALLRPLRLEPKAGFIIFNGQTYRDALELIPKENGKLAIVNALKLEDYLVGVVNKEIRSDYPREAIKAQIVAARSYALATLADRRKNRVSLWDLQSTEMDQVYDGSGAEDSRSHQFVKETLGQVLTYSGQVLRAFYHSANGGFTEQPINVWGDQSGSGSFDRNAYDAKSSPIDREKTPSAWQIHLSPQMGELLFGVGRIKELRVLARTSGQRVSFLQITGEKGSLQLSGANFRRKLGNRWLKSTLFWVSKKGSNFLIDGRGFGHGVGLSQLGARAMARTGKTYREILKFYYPRSDLTELAQIRKIEKQPVPIVSGTPLPMVR